MKSIFELERTTTGGDALAWFSAVSTSGGTTSGTVLRATATAVALVATMLVAGGTGGRSVQADTFSASRTTAELSVQSRPRRVRTAVRTTLPVSERVRAIQRRFSLNIGQLANVLGVGRPAVYRWLHDTGKPQSANLERLNKVYALAEEWVQLSDKPVGKYLLVPLTNGVSMAGLLERESIDAGEIREAMRSVAASLRASEDRKRRSGYRGVAEVMAERGYDEEPPDVQRSNIDGLLGE